MDSTSNVSEASTSPAQNASSFVFSNEFLELAFGHQVESFNVYGGTKPGDNYMSAMYAVDVKFEENESLCHYLIKCYPNNPSRKEFLDDTNMFEKELFFYADFLPKLNQLNVETGSKIILSLAPFHGGNAVGSDMTTAFKGSPWAQENFLIMTDLRKTYGCKMLDRLTGLDIPHTELVLQEIAKLHASSWAYKQKNGLRLLTSKYRHYLDTMYLGKTIDQFRPMLKDMGTNAVKVVESELCAEHPASKGLKAIFAQDTIAIVQNCLQAEGMNVEKVETLLRVKSNGNLESSIAQTAETPWLLGCHGDCWLNNLLFRYDKNSDNPVEVTLVDFQLSHEACPTTDLTYFLFTSVRAPTRFIEETRFLCVYFDAFTKYCAALGVPTLPGFSFESLQARYRRAKLFGLLYSLPVLCLILKPEGESIDMDKQKGDSIAELFSAEMDGAEENSLFQAEMTATALNLYENGVI